MAAWLGRQRKPELLALAVHTTLEELEGLRKEELVSVLDEHLQQNSTKYTDNAAFKEYYGRSSPTKRSSGAALTSDGEVKPKKPRAPKVKKEADATDAGPSSSAGASSALTPAPARTQSLSKSHAATRTPSAALHGRLSTFPPSPAVVTDAIDAQTRKFSAQLDKALVKANVRTVLYDIRELTSSVVGIESLIILIEGFHLQKELIPWRRAFEVPPIGALGTDSHPVSIPDLFVVLTDVYWKSTTLWLLVSFFVPLLFSWFFNLTHRPVNRNGQTVQKPRWRCDPLTFNTAKALLSWLVFAQGASFFGLYSDITIESVKAALPGGFSGLLIGSFIGILASLYDAAQRK